MCAQPPGDEAVRWWNTLIGEKNVLKPIPESPPEVPKFRTALQCLSPIFAIPFDNDVKDSEFWRTVHRIVILFHACDFVPVPNILFPAFVLHLYSIRGSFERRDVELVISVIELTEGRSTPRFLFWSLQERLKDIVLVLETLIEMVERKHIIWRQVAVQRGNMDLFFDRYLSFLDQCPQKETIAVMLLIELVTRVFLEYGKHTKPRVESELWAKLARFLSSYNMSMALCAFRSMILIWNETKLNMPAAHHNSWLIDMINASVRPSYVHDLVWEFVLGVSPTGFNTNQLVTVLISQTPQQPSDIKVLGDLALLPCCQNQLPIIRRLMELSVSDKLWSSTACEYVKDPLLKFADRQVIQFWMISFTKHAFAFVAMSCDKKKYQRKARMVITTFDTLYELGLEYLNALVTVCYSALVNAGKVPNVATHIPVNETVDKQFMRLVEDIEKYEVNLKDYMLKTNEEQMSTSRSCSDALTRRQRMHDPRRYSIHKPVHVFTPTKPSAMVPRRRTKTISASRVPLGKLLE